MSHAPRNQRHGDGETRRHGEVSPRLCVPCLRVRAWCPRKDLNLQPLVCRTSALSVELLGREMVVGVGIEPTFRAFQTRANPSQLSDRKEGDEFLTPSAFARCAPFQ